MTNNRTSMPVHLADRIAQGRHVPGIIILNPKLSIGQNIDDLILIAGASFDDEYQDRIVHLPVPCCAHVLMSQFQLKREPQPAHIKPIIHCPFQRTKFNNFIVGL